MTTTPQYDPTEPPASYEPYGAFTATNVAPPLDQPWYGIGFAAAFVRPFHKYAQFRGRASRGEYWWFALANGLFMFSWFLVIGVIGFLCWGCKAQHSGVGSRDDIVITAAIGLFILYGVIMVIPSLALTMRRLHDINKSGWWYFVALVPYVGSIWLLVLLASPTYPGPTQWDTPGVPEAPRVPEARVVGGP